MGWSQPKNIVQQLRIKLVIPSLQILFLKILSTQGKYLCQFLSLRFKVKQYVGRWDLQDDNYIHTVQMTFVGQKANLPNEIVIFKRALRII